MLVGVAVLIAGIIAVYDLTQRRHTITRNFPVIGHFRYWFEEVGHPLRQDWFAGDRDERPYRPCHPVMGVRLAKGQNNLVGFGSQADHQEPGRILIIPGPTPIGVGTMATSVGRSGAPRIALRRVGDWIGMGAKAIHPV